MATAFNALVNVQLNAQSLNTASREVRNSLGRITGASSEFQKSLDASTARVFAFGATTFVINGITQAFNALVGTTIEVEKRLIGINAIFGGTASQFQAFRDSIFDVAKKTGQSFSIVADGAEEFARQGLGAAETAKRLEAALILTNISGLDSVKSVKTLTAAINGFSRAGLDAVSITNKIVAVDTKFAVSAQDLADGLSRAGSTAEDANVSFDELLGLITAVEQRTARGGAVIGNAFKSIFTRLSRSSTISELQELGVEINSSQSGVQKLQALSKALDQVSDPNKASQIKELAGGVYQINVVSAALKDLSDQNSVFANASKASAGATNEGFAKNAELMKSMSAQINALIVGLTNMAEKVGQITFAPLLKNLVGIANSFTEFFDKALDPEKGNAFIQGIFKAIGTFISGPGLVLITGAFLRIVSLVAKFAKEGFESVMKIGSAEEKIQNINAGITRELVENEKFRKAILDKTLTQEQKEQLINKTILERNKLYNDQKMLLEAISRVALKSGVTGYESGVGYVNKKNKPIVKARGFAPSFAETMAETSAAREHGYKAGKVYNTRLYDGSGGSFKATVNSAETVKTVRGANGKLGTYVIPPNGFHGRGFVPNYANKKPSKNELIRGAVEAGKYKIEGGAYVFEDPTLGMIFKSQVDKALGSGARMALAEEKNKESRIQIDAKDYGMLIPNIGINKFGITQDGVLDKKTKTGFSISNLDAFGPKVPLRIDKAAGNRDEELEENIWRGIIQSSLLFANVLRGPKPEVTYSQIEHRLKSQKGAKGAIRSAVGSGFEAAVLTSFSRGRMDDSVIEKLNLVGGDFDLRGAGDDIRTLFGVPENKVKKNIFDFKASTEKGNIESMAKKIYKEEPIYRKSRALTAKQKIKQAEAQKTIGIKNMASGFIPNFAAPKRMSPLAASRITPSHPVFQLKAGDETKFVGFGEGFVPNFASYVKSQKYGKNRLAKTKNESYLEFNHDKDRNAFDIEMMESFKKGDAFALFSHLARMAKKTKKGIISENILPQDISKEEKQKMGFKDLSNFDKLLKVFPQLRYRQIPDLKTSGQFGYDEIEFTDLLDLKNLVNKMSKKEFNDQIKGGVTYLESTYEDSLLENFANGFVPNFASYVYDSDRIPADKGATLKAILASKAKKNLLIAPAGAGKSTTAAKLGKFLTGASDVSKASEINILSGAARAKGGGMSKQLESLLESVNNSGGKVSYLHVKNMEIMKRRMGRGLLDGDLRNEKQLKGTRFAPLNQFDFVKAVKSRAKRFEVLNAGSGFVPNFANYEDDNIPSYVRRDMEKSQSFKKIKSLYKKFPNMSYLGRGAESFAFKNGQEVLKVPTFGYKGRKQIKEGIGAIKGMDWTAASNQLSALAPNLEIFPPKTSGAVISQSFAGDTVGNVIKDYQKANDIGSKVSKIFSEAQKNNPKKPNWLNPLYVDAGSAHNFTFPENLSKAKQEYFNDPSTSVDEIFNKNKIGLIDLGISKYYVDRIREEEKSFAKVNSIRAGGFVPNFADFSNLNYIKSPEFAKNQKRRQVKAKTYRKASGVIGSLFKTLPEAFFQDGVLGDGANGLETSGIFSTIKNSLEYAAAFGGPKASQFVSEAGKYGLKVSGSLQKKLANIAADVVVKRKGLAKGFIPNFSAVGDAIKREKAAGVPASKIYLDSSPQLKSYRNPMGMMVANSIDEPKGGFQGINRARKEGRNPKTYGAAGGFVPNFATDDFGDFIYENESKILTGLIAGVIAAFGVLIYGIVGLVEKKKAEAEITKKVTEENKKILNNSKQLADARQKELRAIQDSIRARAGNQSVLVKPNTKAGGTMNFFKGLGQKTDKLQGSLLALSVISNSLSDSQGEFNEKLQQGIGILSALQILQGLGGGLKGPLKGLGKTKPVQKVGEYLTRGVSSFAPKFAPKAVGGSGVMGAIGTGLRTFGSRALSLSRLAGPVGLVAGATYGGVKLGGYARKKISEKTNFYKTDEELEEETQKANYKVDAGRLRGRIGLAAATKGFAARGDTKAQKAELEDFLKRLYAEGEGEKAENIEKKLGAVKEASKLNEAGEIDFAAVKTALDQLKSAVDEGREAIGEQTLAAKAEKEAKLKSIEDFKNAASRYAKAIEEQASSLNQNKLGLNTVGSVFVDPEQNNANLIRSSIELGKNVNETKINRNAVNSVFSGETFKNYVSEKQKGSSLGGYDLSKVTALTQNPEFANKLVTSLTQGGSAGLKKDLSSLTGIDIDESTTEGKELVGQIMESVASYQASIIQTQQDGENRILQIVAEKTQLEKQSAAIMQKAFDNLPARLNSILENKNVDVLGLGKGYREVAEEKDPVKAAQKFAALQEQDQAYADLRGEEARRELRESQGLTKDKTKDFEETLAKSKVFGGGKLKNMFEGRSLSKDERKFVDTGVGSKETMEKVAQRLDALSKAAGRPKSYRDEAATYSQAIRTDISKGTADQDVEAKKELDKKLLNLQAETEMVTEQLRLFKEGLGGASKIADSVTLLGKAVTNANTNLNKFGDMAQRLGLISDNIDGKLAAIQEKLNKIGNNQ